MTSEDVSVRVTVDPPWLRVARSEVGVREAPGSADNPRVVEYHAATKGRRKCPDAVPWCSSFANWCLREAGYRSGPHGEYGPTASKAARSWLRWGVELDAPLIGCVCVLSRGKPPAGHVGFWMGESDGKVWLLGGNQGDAVSLVAYPRRRVLAYRWPVGLAA